MFKNIFKKPKVAMAVLLFFFSISGLAYAQIGGTLGGQLGTDPSGGTGGGGRNPDLGQVRGYGWMGTEINNQNQIEGGGGWLKFNCAPEDCETQWGVEMDLDEELDETYGNLTGQAWSSNYGWLSFDYDLVQSCWEANPTETANSVATAIIDSSSTKNPIVGWAKFIAGDDNTTDNWDGCVSFSGVEYSVLMDTATGELTGWAWGGPIVGWISFQNPECPFCDTQVVLSSVVDITFWADQYNVPVGGGSRLRWAAQNTPTAQVISCSEYGNTSGYTHWNDSGSFLAFANIDEISIQEGNLPTGFHPINNIQETTTYDLTCKDSNGNTLPTRYVTIVVAQPISGCMDPLALNYEPTANTPTRCIYSVSGCTDSLASNYNPLAVTDDGSCIYNGNPSVTNLNLDVNPTSLEIGSGQYNVGLTWTSNNPTNLTACVGLPVNSNGLIDSGLQTNWDGNRASPNVTNPFVVNLAPYASGASAGQTFIFKIRCDLVDADGQMEDSATVIMTAPSAPPVLPPSVDVRILTPNANGGFNSEVLPSSGSMVTLDWTMSNVQLDTCNGTSLKYDNTTGVSLGEGNNDWDNNPFSSGPGLLITNMTNPGNGNGTATSFTLTCLGDDNVTTVSDTVNICLGEGFCSIISGGGFPGYEEF